MISAYITKWISVLPDLANLEEALMIFFNRIYVSNKPIITSEKLKFNPQGVFTGNPEIFSITTHLRLTEKSYGHSGCQNHKIGLEEN